MNRLTIGVTSYNKSKYIKDCLESIPDWVDVIIVDDSSTDNTVDIIEQYYDYNIIKLPINKNVSFCRNLIIDKCNTEYLIFLDGDDILMIDQIRTIIQTFDKNIYIFPYYVSYPEQNKFFKYSNIRNDIRNINCILASMIFNVEFIKKNKILFDTNLQNLEDFDFILQCLTFDKPNYIKDLYICNYRKFSDGKRLKNSFKIKTIIRDKYLK